MNKAEVQNTNLWWIKKKKYLCKEIQNTLMKNPLIHVALRYGSVASLLLMVLFMVMFYLGKHPMSIPLFFDIRLLILPIFMVIGMKDFRDNLQSGNLHFWQGFSIGFIIFLTISFFMAFFIIVFVWADGSFLDSYIAERVQLLTQFRSHLAETIGDETIQLQLEKLPLTTSFDLAIDYFSKTLVIGLFLNIIISIILRKTT